VYITISPKVDEWHQGLTTLWPAWWKGYGLLRLSSLCVVCCSIWHSV